MSLTLIVEQLQELLDDTDIELAELNAERVRIVAMIAAAGGAPAATLPTPTPAPVQREVRSAPRPKSAGGRPRADGTAARKPDLEEVARVYNEAIAAGKPTTKALVDHFGANESTAKNWPTQCRAAGLLPAVAKPAPKPSSTSGPTVWTPAMAAAVIERAS